MNIENLPNYSMVPKILLGPQKTSLREPVMGLEGFSDICFHLCVLHFSARINPHAPPQTNAHSNSIFTRVYQHPAEPKSSFNYRGFIFAFWYWYKLLSSFYRIIISYCVIVSIQFWRQNRCICRLSLKPLDENWANANWSRATSDVSSL